MSNIIAAIRNRLGAALVGLAAAATLSAAPLAAQGIESVDPNTAIGSGIDADLDGNFEERPGDAPLFADEQPATAPPSQGGSPSFDDWSSPAPAGSQTGGVSDWDAGNMATAPAWSDPVVTAGDAETAASQASANPAIAADQGDTYKEDDLIGAAEGVFGKGAEGVAKMIQKLLAEQGEPNGYIVGREGGGAFILGARYGSGTLYHKVEGQMPVYWTGPSIGFDAGANAGNTFVLVYNLYDTEQLYERFPAGEGQAYLVGGMNASYLRKGDTVLIPIRVGAGLRLGINAGYMRFSKKHRWLPF